MSDGAQNRMKVSREGIVLIKSFEGLRPNAVPHEDGGWVIGYGHRRSAREGLTVGEADAELLLQYDLIPVVAALNDSAAAHANQHQFDALASFALSVGVDQFQQSDVFQRLSAGRPAEVADALLAWPEPVRADTGLRRRAAERALFVADPNRPVALAELLAAPLPPPPPPADEETAETQVGVSQDARAAAVAALLGEQAPETADTTPDPEGPVLTPAFGASAAATTESEPVVETEAETVAETTEITPASEPETVVAAEVPAVDPVADPIKNPAPAPVNLAAAFQMQRYSPYAGAGFGALPTAPIPSEAAPDLSPPVLAESVVEEPAPTEPPVAPDTMADATTEIAAEAVARDEAEAPAEIETAEARPVEASALAFDEAPPEVRADVPAEPLHIAATVSPPPALVLTPLDETTPAEGGREVWPAEARTPSAVDEAALFEDDTGLTLGPVLRHEAEPEHPAGFDWSGVGAFIVMSGVGLVSIGAALAAVRRVLADGDGGREFGLIAAALGIIGLVTIGVSTWNLYLRLARKEND